MSPVHGSTVGFCCSVRRTKLAADFHDVSWRQIVKIWKGRRRLRHNRKKYQVAAPWVAAAVKKQLILTENHGICCICSSTSGGMQSVRSNVSPLNRHLTHVLRQNRQNRSGDFLVQLKEQGRTKWIEDDLPALMNRSSNDIRCMRVRQVALIGHSFS
mmetsp:Transcript_69054/g.214358  ORF Transcript_69054/g.214358 Transcript_69054/m.214358 type:complete len:157 (-) Transcript_69054:132-602(-)